MRLEKKRRVIALVGVVLTAWVVGSSAYAVGYVRSPFGGTGQGIVMYDAPTGVSSPMRSTSTMRTGTNYYAPSTVQGSTTRSYGGLSSGIGVTHQGALHRGIYTVGATSPHGDVSSSSYRAPSASGPRRMPAGEGATDEYRTDEEGTWWWDGEEWVLINPSGGSDMGDVTQPVGDAPWLMLLLMITVYGMVNFFRKERA